MNDRNEAHADLGRTVAALKSARAGDQQALALLFADAVNRGRLLETAWGLARLGAEALERWDGAQPGAATAWVERIGLDAAFGEVDER